ncbi:coth protein-domain-containing protein [Neocallimastix lanati (nom. inval.)]|nr:coth protein-domain-containing protein [Neocallimastix sp. JGI-2020a]
MKLLGNSYLLLCISLFGFCYAKVEDYLKGIEFERTFSPIEGKVIDVKIAIPEKDYNDIIEKSQLSAQEFGAIYHGNYPEELKYTVKVSVNITVDDQVYSYDKVKFKVDGNNARIFNKLGYNLNLNKKDQFFGRKNLRLRADYFDITHIRAKLAVDLINKWNIPTVQETYANLYINDKYFGFYMFLDDIKPGWIQDIYQLPEDEEVKTLYSCSKSSLFKELAKTKKDEYLNYTEPLYDLIDETYNYTSIEQLESKFDNVDIIRKTFIYEYLFGATDNFLMTGNNYNFYQKSNGKWDYIPVDFNSVFFVNLKRLLATLPFHIPKLEDLIGYTTYSFEEWHAPGVRKPFIDILYSQDKEGFVEELKELLITCFNPDELLPRIDELHEFIVPYIERDTTPDENGNLPGRINLKGITVPYTIEESKRNVNFDNDNDGNIGLKRFIEAKFDAVCKLYGINKNEILRKAKIYRSRRALEIKIYNLKQIIFELQTKFNEMFKK